MYQVWVVLRELVNRKDPRFSNPSLKVIGGLSLQSDIGRTAHEGCGGDTKEGSMAVERKEITGKRGEGLTKTTDKALAGVAKGRHMKTESGNQVHIRQN